MNRKQFQNVLNHASNTALKKITPFASHQLKFPELSNNASLSKNKEIRSNIDKYKDKMRSVSLMNLQNTLSTPIKKSDSLSQLSQSNVQLLNHHSVSGSPNLSHSLMASPMIGSEAMKQR